MSWGWADAQLLYTHPKAVYVSIVWGFQPPKHKSRHVLTLPLLFDMFLSTLKWRFPRFSAHRNSWSTQQWTESSKTLSRIWGRTNPTLGQFIFMRLVQHLQMSWTSFSKPSSPSSGVDLAPVIRICNRKMLEPDLSRPVAFPTYLEDRGSHFP